MKNKIFYILIFLLFFSKSFAHESRPVTVKISQRTEKQLVVQCIFPNSIAASDLPMVNFSKINRSKNSIAIIKQTSNSYVVEEVFDGEIEALKNQKISIVYPNGNPTLTTILQLYYDKKLPQIIVLSPTENSIDLSEKKDVESSSFSFIGLGVEHIFKGVDHLLFIVCLFIICGVSAKLFWAITGFTIAHSVTLFLTVLNVINFPAPFIEVLIALSIVFLCTEILKKGDSLTLTQSYPIVVTTFFGLIHGVGFASVLNEIKLPKSNLLLSLLNFNIGVEIGQLIFLGVLIFIVFALKKTTFSSVKFGLKYATYGIGSLAAFWTIERIISWY